MAYQNFNAYIQEYGRETLEVLQKRTFLYEGVFQPMAQGDWDRQFVDYLDEKDTHTDINDPLQKIASTTNTYTRRIVGKRDYGSSIDMGKIKATREGNKNQMGDMITTSMNSLSRKKNAFIREDFWKDGAELTDNQSSSAVAFPSTDAAYVVHADAATNARHGAPASTFGLHIDKILVASELLLAQGYDPNVDSEGCYLICSAKDFNQLKTSKSSANNEILTSSDYSMMPFDIRLDSGEVVQRPRIKFSNNLWIIIDDAFFANGANAKTTGVGSTTLTNGRRLPMFMGSCFRWYDTVVEPLAVRQLPDYYSKYALVEARQASLTRVQEKGIVEIEVATGVST